MSTTPETHATAPAANDRVRQWTVLIGSLLAIAAAAVWSGAWGGTPIQDAAGGALAADATLVAPATSAFSIWSFIYAGLLLFAFYQLAPSRASDPRLRAIAWWVLASMVLNAVWIAVIQAGWLWASVLVIAALVAVLGVIASRLAGSPPQNWTERLTTDVALGLYLGWVVIATVANLTAAIASGLSDFSPGDGTACAIGVLVVAAVLSATLAWKLRPSPALAFATGVALAWGLWWIAVGRLTEAPDSVAVGWAAGVAAIIAFSTPFAMRDASYIGRDDPLAPR